MNDGFVKSYKAEAAIAGSLIVMAGIADHAVVAANANDALIFGIADSLGAATGGMCDVHRSGIQPVKVGGTFAAGDPLTADASGRAIKAVPEAGKVVRVVGFAEVDAVLNDVADCFISPSLLYSA